MIYLNGKKLAGLARGVAMFKSVLNADARLAEAQDSPLKNAHVTCLTCGHTTGSTFHVTLGRLCSETGCRCADPVHSENLLENADDTQKMYGVRFRKGMKSTSGEKYFKTEDARAKWVEANTGDISVDAYTEPRENSSDDEISKIKEIIQSVNRHAASSYNTWELSPDDYAKVQSKLSKFKKLSVDNYGDLVGIVYVTNAKENTDPGKCKECGEPLDGTACACDRDMENVLENGTLSPSDLEDVAADVANRALGTGDSYRKCAEVMMPKWKAIDSSDHALVIDQVVRFLESRGKKNSSDSAIIEQLTQVKAEIGKLDAMGAQRTSQDQHRLELLQTTKAGLEKALRESDPPLHNAGTIHFLFGAGTETQAVCGAYVEYNTPKKPLKDVTCKACLEDLSGEKQNAKGDTFVVRMYEGGWKAIITEADGGTNTIMASTRDEVVARAKELGATPAGKSNAAEYPHDILPNSKAGLDRGSKKYGETK